MRKVGQNFFWGGIMALGELLPGVGMQTVAIIAGLFDDLIDFFYQGTEFARYLFLFFFKKATKEEVITAFWAIDWKFGIPVAISLIGIVALLSGAIHAAFEQYPAQLAAISFGLVMGTLPIPLREMERKTWREIALATATFITFVIFFSLNATEFGVAREINVFMYFAAGLLAAFAGFFPGISISFALLIMGLYQPLFGAINQLISGNWSLPALATIFFFGSGLLLGMLFCVRMLSYFLHKYRTLFLAFIFGLIAASLRAVWPFLSETGEVLLPWEVRISTFTSQVALITVAFLLVSGVRKLAEGKGTFSTSFGPKEKTIVTTY